MKKQGFIRAFNPGPRLIRWLLNVWPPYLGMGIRVTHLARDFRHVKVRMRMGILNRNYVGTHFGGSLFAMTDPFYVIMMSHLLGRDYVVWDKSSSIRFRAPGRGTVSAEIEVTQAMIDDAIVRTSQGSKFEPSYVVRVLDARGTVVAEVEKTLYIRRVSVDADNVYPLGAAQ
jgi:acyl-coenzyme A thioesterase PaaI-like protein